MKGHWTAGRHSNTTVCSAVNSYLNSVFRVHRLVVHRLVFKQSLFQSRATDAALSIHVLPLRTGNHPDEAGPLVLCHLLREALASKW